MLVGERKRGKKTRRRKKKEFLTQFAWPIDLLMESQLFDSAFDSTLSLCLFGSMSFTTHRYANMRWTTEFVILFL